MGTTPTVDTGSDHPAEVTVTLVLSRGCHFCVDAQAALEELQSECEFRVEAVDSADDAGRELLRKHRAALRPLVLVDGEYFSAGRLPRGKLRRALLASSTTRGLRP